MAKEIIEFKIPEWAVCPLVNGDYSALNDEDQEKLDRFINNTVNTYGHAMFSANPEADNYDLGFCTSNDIDKLGGDCVTLTLLIDSEAG